MLRAFEVIRYPLVISGFPNEKKSHALISEVNKQLLTMFIFLSRFTELRKRTKLEAETKVTFITCKFNLYFIAKVFYLILDVV